MKIVFANDELRNDCNNQELLVKRHGSHRAKLLRQRLDELFNSEVLEDMRKMPHVIIHGAPEGPSDLELDLGAPFRLIFRPYPPSQHSSGDWDWNKIDSIIILGLRK